MHIKTTLGKDLEICAERDYWNHSDWQLSVSKMNSIHKVNCGVLRFFEGKILRRYASDVTAISNHPYIKTEIHADLLGSSERRLAKMISMFLDVEYVMED